MSSPYRLLYVALAFTILLLRSSHSLRFGLGGGLGALAISSSVSKLHLGVPNSGSSSSGNGNDSSNSSNSSSSSGRNDPAASENATPTSLPSVDGIAFGANNFGDIMGGCEAHVTVGGNAFTPLERVVLTANGNLQRIMSAYYGAPVSVRVKRCDKVEQEQSPTNNTGVPVGVYDREVDLVMGEQVFCTAAGRIELFDSACVEAIESRSVGLGQLFRYLGALPQFELLEAGRKGNGVLWRKYSLSCPQLKCVFVETFVLGFLEMLPPAPNSAKL